ncbi:MAG: DUF2304 domain-containing protein [Phycisphaeraceae bacterium]|nr:DUF2304 domain-containing protein [Phycisphaeraceae bacterium]
MIRTLVLFSFGILLVGLSVQSLRKLRLQERYVILFAITGIPFLAMSYWPDGILWLSTQMNMEKPTLMIFILGAFTILLLLKLFSIISVQQRQITTLAQMVGILNQKLEPKNSQTPTPPGSTHAPTQSPTESHD